MLVFSGFFKKLFFYYFLHPRSKHGIDAWILHFFYMILMDRIESIGKIIDGCRKFVQFDRIYMVNFVFIMSTYVIEGLIAHFFHESDVLYYVFRLYSPFSLEPVKDCHDSVLERILNIQLV